MKSTTCRLDFFTEQKGADYLDLRMIEFFPQSSQFKQAYGEGAACTLVVFDDYDPHQPATFLCRSYLEDAKEIGCRGNFIVVVRSHNSGVVTTVDLISLKGVDNYQELVSQYLQRESCPDVPTYFANGYFERVSTAEIKFISEEGDYGSQLLSFDGAEVATFVHTACTKHPCHTRKLPGKDFFFEIGEFISENKLKADFYAYFADKFMTVSQSV